MQQAMLRHTFERLCVCIISSVMTPPACRARTTSIILSSTVLATKNLTTVTSRFWPMRQLRPMACRAQLHLIACIPWAVARCTVLSQVRDFVTDFTHVHVPVPGITVATRAGQLQVLSKPLTEQWTQVDAGHKPVC